MKNPKYLLFYALMILASFCALAQTDGLRSLRGEEGGEGESIKEEGERTKEEGDGRSESGGRNAESGNLGERTALANGETEEDGSLVRSESGMRKAEVGSGGRPVTVYRVPVTDAISKPNEYILRRAVKQAIDEEIDVLVLDMDTPGGRLDVTLEMMEMLSRFPGETITYVNADAISAGAYISMATDAIYFAPNGVMGAAAVVSSGGEEIDQSMKAKINSYLLARMRSYTSEHPYRAEVIRAMADLDYVLEIDGVVLKPEGELLSLTAEEAVQEYGEPSRPLLAEGIASDLDGLLEQRYGEGMATLISFETSWAEDLAKYLDSLSPILLALGLLALFIEFKTPGFGLFGIAGLILLGILFATNYIAGLAGYEAILLFLLGITLIALELFLFPGTIFFFVIGGSLVLISLVWSMVDIWPTMPGGEEGEDGLGFTFDRASLVRAIYELMLALALAVAGLMAVWKLLPKTSIFSHLVIQEVSGGVAMAGVSPDRKPDYPDIGATGKVVRSLHPGGEVEIDGVRYNAQARVGMIDAGTPVVVTAYRAFGIEVDRTS